MLVVCRQLPQCPRCAVQHVSGAEEKQYKDSCRDVKQSHDTAQLHPSKGMLPSL